MRYKLIQSTFLDKDAMWAPFEKELRGFDTTYDELKPLIIEQDIPTLQQHIASGTLSYERLVKFYLYRIRLLESNPKTTLHAIQALNPNIINEAKQKDRQAAEDMHPIYGMPILLKDNINTANMPTTAGAAILENHFPDEDAFVVKQLKNKGALILGKVNLSEWAYYFCEGCPVGYSAIGGQTLNPYGRRIFETGGSSSGSAVAVAANYAAAALGSETSGSILSPSSQNAVVGLKPTIGFVSRTGIVPISSTLDTSGPMTKSIADTAILLDAIAAPDPQDKITLRVPRLTAILDSYVEPSLSGMRIGAMTNILAADSLYRNAVEDLRAAGAEVIEFTPKKITLSGFTSILNGDMKRDIPAYFKNASTADFATIDVTAIIDFNKQDSLLYMPYSQKRLDGVIADSITEEGLETTISELNTAALGFFQDPIAKYELDAIISKNNYYAGHAAIAFYPCLTVPMGYADDGEPANLTFMAPSFSEVQLLSLGAAYERISNHRKSPEGYQ
uniref:Glutamyl-tRNA(Gln) amidotransferase subunit A n=1 Tax=uncultured Flavobacteriia bacterium TaxID=212695 RepID=H6RF98_9BACT|nr:glutamyl-tRNA(Gln) amidotransferase subunit A [uncultured Flavobacteriia bacterium]